MVKVVKRFSCEEAVELVTAFLEGELGEPTRHRFEEHLDSCEGCERYLGQFRVTVEALGRLRATGAPERLRTATGTADTDETTEAGDPRHDTPGGTVDAPDAIDAADATGTADAPRVTPGPGLPESLTKGTRDRLLAAFRAGRPT